MRLGQKIIIAVVPAFAILIVQQSPTKPDTAAREAKLSQAKSGVREAPRPTGLRGGQEALSVSVGINQPASAPKQADWFSLLLDAIDRAEQPNRPMASEVMADILQCAVTSVPFGELESALSQICELQGKTPSDVGAELQIRLLQRWAEQDVRAPAAWLENHAAEQA